MTLKATSGRLLYGASVVTGALALAEFVFLFAPKIRPLAHLLELLELYLGNINPAFKGLGTSRFAQLELAVR